MLLLVGVFVWRNRRRAAPGLWASGVAPAALGSSLNALATLIFGAMPVSMEAANQAGYSFAKGDSAPRDYVFSEGLGPVAFAMGDFLPVPGVMTVLSVGDLFLVPGLALILLHVLVVLFREPSGDTTSTHERGEHEELQGSHHAWRDRRRG